MNASTQMQLAMRRNAEELHEVVSELDSWEKEIAARDARLRGAELPATAAGAVSDDDDDDDEAAAAAEAAANRAAAAAAAAGAATAGADALLPDRLDHYTTWDRYDADAEARAIDERSAREARVADKQRRRDAAALAARRAVADADAAVLRARGNAAYGGARYEEATLLYTEALILNPRCATSYANRGLCLLKLGRPHEAEEDCSAALLLDRVHVKALLRRADARETLRDWEGALSDLAAVLSLEPKHTKAKQALRTVGERAKETRLQGRQAPEVQRTRAQLCVVQHDPRHDADPFVLALAGRPPPAAGGGGGGGGGGGAPSARAAAADPSAQTTAAAAAAATALRASGIVASSGSLPPPASTTSAFERALTTGLLKRESAQAAAYLQRFSASELSRLTKPGLNPEPCAALVDALAELVEASKRPAAGAHAHGGASATGAPAPLPGAAAAECAARLLVCLGSMQRLELALAFLDGDQLAALSAAIAHARARGLGADDGGAVDALEAALGS